jgi:organic hydroperoxide reductase OsmC/OhrA
VKVSATVANSAGEHHVSLATDGASRSLAIPPKSSGSGSSASGGELLFLALATCYCNDIYREAAKRDIAVHRVEVEVEGEFGGPGDPASRVAYHAKVVASASDAEIEALMRHTDTVAEIQNTLRTPTPVTLERTESVPMPASGEGSGEITQGSDR